MATVYAFIALIIVGVFAKSPPLYGPIQCEITKINLGNLVAGCNQHAYLMYPKNYAKDKIMYPFLAFGHGMIAGGDVTDFDYQQLWKSTCSRGYIIAGPMSCCIEWCENFYQDIITTINDCKTKGKQLHPSLEYANFTEIGVYGHSMGGAMTVHTVGTPGLNIVAAVALHPALWVDKNATDASKEVKVPMIWFTGNNDLQVPAPTVHAFYNDDPTTPKIFAELTGVDHFDCTTIGRNLEDPYVGEFMNCMIKDNSTSCEYFFGNDKNQNICSGGPKMTKCQVNGTNF
eukprot:478086_1